LVYANLAGNPSPHIQHNGEEVMYGSVPVGHRPLLDYRPLVGDQTIEEISKLAEPLAGAKVLHLTITAFETATADRLAGLVPLMNACGLHADWQVIRTSEEYAAANHAVYNALAGDFVEWGMAAEQTWLKYNAMNADLFDGDYDFVVIHDPQPAGILPEIIQRTGKKPTGKWIWRSHLDLAEAQTDVWSAILEQLHPYDAMIYSAEEWAVPELKDKLSTIVPETIDPLNAQNIEISTDTVNSILPRYNIDPHRPTICQVSRFDSWSDPTGAIDVYRKVKEVVPEVQLLLVASVLSSESEMWPYYERTARYAGEDFDVHLLSSLNSIGQLEINAFQRSAQVAIQRSVRKGFSSAIVEAGWKRKPVVAGVAGGLHMQIIDGVTGFLGSTVEQNAEQIMRLLQDRELAERVGQAGHEHVRNDFLITTSLKQYLKLFNTLVAR
jgi:trehalose synthase